MAKNSKQGYLLPFILVTSLFMLWGIANNMNDTLLAAFKRIMSMSDLQTSLVQFAFYGSYFCFALPAALFIRRFSFKSGILVGLSMYAAGTVLFTPAARKIWPYELPNYNEEMLARLLFCFENDPEQDKGHISGAQDAIGICMSGLNRHYYDNTYWPLKIESINDEETLQWLENHLCLVAMFPRRPGFSVVEGKNVTPEKVAALADAANRCWEAIKARNLKDFARAFQDSFNAQTSMFPAMKADGTQAFIDRYAPISLAHKFAGAGGGGYLALVVDGDIPDGAHPLKIRRKDTI